MGKVDYDIAKKIKLKPVNAVAQEIGLHLDEVYPVGPYMAKIQPSAFERLSNNKDGKLILVSAMTPTPSGEGKSTTSIGLGMALNKLNKKTIVALREPSLGPCFGIKGGAAGGGFSQVLPMEDINLHFTSDLHATTAAHNLLAAMIDNHLHHGNKLNIDPRTVTWRRVVDMNDRSLRKIVIGLGGASDGVPRETGFDVTVASEVMATLCLSSDLMDLKTRLGKIVIGYDFSKNPIRASDLKANGAMAALLKHAIHPNLVQTIEGTAAFIHGGPFANIAHGCSSVIATKLALKLADYCITEAGFAFDLGGEKFLNIKCRTANLQPSCVVLVATIKAVRFHGGFENLKRHIENIHQFNLPVVVAVNKFTGDDPKEIENIISQCHQINVRAVVSDVWAKGSQGGTELAKAVDEVCAQPPPKLQYTYETDAAIEEKISSIVTKIYKGRDVVYSPAARKVLEQIKQQQLTQLPVCMAKTQYSFSDNPKLTGAPENFSIEIRELRIAAGAGFIVALTGEIMTMPGLPIIAAAENIDIDGEGNISGLF